MLSMFPFARDEIAPSWWANAIQKRLSNGATNFVVSKASATAIQVVAGVDAAAAVVDIAGKWRWNEVSINRAHPGGVAGVYDIFVTGKANSIVSAPAPGTDATDYSFALAIVSHNAAPPIVAGVVDIFRKAGELDWDGAAISAIRQSLGAPTLHAPSHQAGGGDDLGLPPIGTIVSYTGQSLPAGGKWDWADGGLIDRTAFAGFFGATGHAYNGGVDPGSNMVRKPDGRGRSRVGADNMGTTGAAGRLTVAAGHANSRGANGGEERHTMTSTEAGMPAHNPTLSIAWPQISYNRGAAAGGPGTGLASSTPDFPVVFIVTGGSASSSVAGQAGAPHNIVAPYEVDNMIVRVA